jgi:hypothetical protein
MPRDEATECGLATSANVESVLQVISTRHSPKQRHADYKHTVF